MTQKLKIVNLFFASSILLLLSCNKSKTDGEFVAYFGGEITNPTTPFVIFCKDNEVIDTLRLDRNNRFFKKFDSLSPGLYTFKHEPEYQYVYFDKNDSLMVTVNSRDFDESVVFCGKGERKNNFLMDLYLKHEADKENMYSLFDQNISTFIKNIDSSYETMQKFYLTKKESINWSDDFDKFAKSALDLHYYSKKEMYPIVHHMRTGNYIINKLPKDFYSYRNSIDFSDPEFNSFSPFVMYLNQMLNNIGSLDSEIEGSEPDIALKTNIKKIMIADTLIKNEKVKNMILNNIAFTYLLEDQNIINNKKFLSTYYKYSTDKSQKNEIKKFDNAIQLLKVGNNLPNVALTDLYGKTINSNTFSNKKTVIFFWTASAASHLELVHKKILTLRKIHPEYQYVAVNLNDSKTTWKKVIDNYNFNGITELHCNNFEEIQFKWAINKIYRTIILDERGQIKNAFANIFDSTFENNL
jgi:peroxiredoxin